MDEEFDKFAVENGFDIAHAAGVGYMSAETEILRKGWLGAKRRENQLLHDYGICIECHSHYVRIDIDSNGFEKMECQCTTESLRHTKIIALMDRTEMETLEQIL